MRTTNTATGKLRNFEIRYLTLALLLIAGAALLQPADAIGSSVFTFQ